MPYLSEEYHLLMKNISLYLVKQKSRRIMHKLFSGGCPLAVSVVLAAVLSGCGTTKHSPSSSSQKAHRPTVAHVPSNHAPSKIISAKRQELVSFSLGLLGTKYRFGGKSLATGFDCSGLVSYVYKKAIQKQLLGNTASIAKQGRSISRHKIKSGDLVFFNTLGRPRSHMGMYIGNGRFVHAPNSRSKVRIDRMDNRYYAKRFEEARTYLN